MSIITSLLTIDSFENGFMENMEELGSWEI